MLEQLQIIGVVKVEGFIIGQRQREPFAIPVQLGRIERLRGGARRQFRERQQCIEIQMLLQRIGQRIPLGFQRRIARLFGRHQPQMAGGERHRAHHRDPAQHRHTGVALDSLLEELIMAIGVDPVDDNASESQCRVKLTKAEHGGSGRGRDRLAIDNQDHRAIERARHAGTAAIMRVETVAIKQPHHPFNH